MVAIRFTSRQLWNLYEKENPKQQVFHWLLFGKIMMTGIHCAEMNWVWYGYIFGIGSPFSEIIRFYKKMKRINCDAGPSTDAISTAVLKRTEDNLNSQRIAKITKFLHLLCCMWVFICIIKLLLMELPCLAEPTFQKCFLSISVTFLVLSLTKWICFGHTIVVEFLLL